MGLDQFAYVVDGDSRVEIARWRKHNRLQGWMTKLALEKGVVESAEDFNCVDLELAQKDLDALFDAVSHERLPETNGCFFGVDSYNYCKKRYLHEEDMAFLEEAKKALKGGLKIVYDCWW